MARDFNTLRTGCERPLVLCVGLGFSGTVSLCAALERLGWRSVHDYTGVSRRVSQQLLRGQLPGEFREYDAILDIPHSTAVLKRLPRLLPRDADWRVIFTTRANRERWINAMLVHLLHSRVLDTSDPLKGGDTDAWRQKYADAHKALKRFPMRDRLLTLDLSSGDGWDELCAFLNVPVPDEPFPRLHTGRALLEEVLRCYG